MAFGGVAGRDDPENAVDVPGLVEEVVDRAGVVVVAVGRPAAGVVGDVNAVVAQVVSAVLHIHAVADPNHGELDAGGHIHHVLRHNRAVIDARLDALTGHVHDGRVGRQLTGGDGVVETDESAVHDGHLHALAGEAAGDHLSGAGDAHRLGDDGTEAVGIHDGRRTNQRHVGVLGQAVDAIERHEHPHERPGNRVDTTPERDDLGLINLQRGPRLAGLEDHRHQPLAVGPGAQGHPVLLGDGNGFGLVGRRDHAQQRVPDSGTLDRRAFLVHAHTVCRRGDVGALDGFVPPNLPVGSHLLGAFALGPGPGGEGYSGGETRQDEEPEETS